MDRPARSFCPRTSVVVATSRLPRVPSGEPLCPPGVLGTSQATQYNVIAFMLVADVYLGTCMELNTGMLVLIKIIVETI